MSDMEFRWAGKNPNKAELTDSESDLGQLLQCRVLCLACFRIGVSEAASFQSARSLRTRRATGRGRPRYRLLVKFSPPRHSHELSPNVPMLPSNSSRQCRCG